MGMFDTVLISKKIIDPLIEDSWKTALSSDEKYYDFQTKSLENFLHYYYIEEDGQVYTTKWYPNSQESSYTEKQKETVTAEVECYDFFQTSSDQIFATFKCILFEGKLTKIELLEANKEPLTVVEERNKRNAQYRELLEQQWEMKLFRLLQTINCKVYRFFYPLNKWYSNFYYSLSKQAEQKVNEDSRFSK